jgi:NitT/TauT family transport system ATP-binding protein
LLLSIAQVLAIDPKILLMDELFIALDVNTRQMLQRQLLRIHQATHKTILFVTHNINEAVTLGDIGILLSRK